MGNYLNPGNEKFRRMIQSEIYVDKTGMIKYTNSVLDTAQNYVCVSRPRRFGKSMAANMLTAYYSRGCNSKELFEKFEIAKDKDFEKKTSLVESTIVEGRNHIVKKLFEVLKHPVIRLSRIKIAFLEIDHLKSGEYRELSIKEVKKLYSLK